MQIGVEPLPEVVRIGTNGRMLDDLGLQRTATRRERGVVASESFRDFSVAAISVRAG